MNITSKTMKVMMVSASGNSACRCACMQALGVYFLTTDVKVRQALWMSQAPEPSKIATREVEEVEEEDAVTEEVDVTFRVNGL